MELVKHHPEFASILAGLGHRNRHTMDKDRTLLDWTPRPGLETALDCARSLIAHGAA